MKFLLQTCHTENATAAIGQRGGIRAVGHEQPVARFPKQSLEGLDKSESCRMANTCSSASPVIEVGQAVGPVLRGLLSLATQQG
ncbi:hypothetical protein ACLIIZ_00360 [Azonexus caeni]|uniref:hypothetical protein n=1 Tax=Azonexus caeni TaxID=266126 RepID=UPI003A855E72